MGGGPIIIIDPAKKYLAEKFNFSKVMRRISTWLAVVNASSVAGLGAYALLDADVKAAFPEWALAALAVSAVSTAVLVPIATSFKQKAQP